MVLIFQVQQQATGGIQQQATMPPLQSLPPNTQHPQQIRYSSSVCYGLSQHCVFVSAETKIETENKINFRSRPRHDAITFSMLKGSENNTKKVLFSSIFFFLLKYSELRSNTYLKHYLSTFIGREWDRERGLIFKQEWLEPRPRPKSRSTLLTLPSRT